MTLQLLESESKGRVISTPKVITQNKETASITSTRTTSYRSGVETSTDDAGKTVTRISYGTASAPLSLSVTPQVTNEGSIIMKVDITKASFVIQGIGVPPDTTNHSVSTNVLVDNGSTVVIGGIYSLIESIEHSGVAFLKDIPLLGWLFRTPHSPEKRKEELIIFLTPRIINEEESGIAEGVLEDASLG